MVTTGDATSPNRLVIARYVGGQRYLQPWKALADDGAPVSGRRRPRVWRLQTDADVMSRGGTQNRHRFGPAFAPRGAALLGEVRVHCSGVAGMKKSDLRHPHERGAVMVSASLLGQSASRSSAGRRPLPVARPGRAEVKPWVNRALASIGCYLAELPEEDKETLFWVIQNNVGRVGRWEAEGHFSSLGALKAKIQEWRKRGLGPHVIVDRDRWTPVLRWAFGAGETRPAAKECPESMYTPEQAKEYQDEIREQVCSRCIERPAGGPPCAPLGKMCGLELHLTRFLKAVHEVESPFIAPYLEHNRCEICADCENKGRSDCPCPMDYLSVLAVQAIETVDQRPE